MAIGRKLRNYFTSVKKYGFVTTTRSYWRRLYERVYEKFLGIRSRDTISLEELGIEHDDRRGHWPTQLHHFRSIQKFLRPDTSDEVFVDYGAGLGRVVILAASLQFKRVIGIEISSILANRARENLSRCRKTLRCKDIEIFTHDATTFEVPTDATTIYFNNPFAGNILTKVLDNIRVSYEKRPRRIKIVCYLPMKSAFEEQICKADGVLLQHRVTLSEGHQCLVFTLK